LKLAFDIFVTCYAFALVLGLAKARDVELLPSLSWFVLMVLPFWVQFESFPETSQSMQAFAVGFVGTCLLIGDSLPVRPAGIGRTAPSKFNEWLRDFRLYGVFLIVLALYHLSLLDHVPLVEKYIGRVHDARELSWMREQTSKLLAVSSLTKYVFTWLVNIAAPLAVVLAWTSGRRVWSLALFAFAVMYAAMSLAKVPLFLLGIILLVTFWQRVAFAKRLAAYLAILLLLVPIGWDAYSFFVSSPHSVFNYRASPAAVAALDLRETDPRARLTIGDHSRLMPIEADSALGTHERIYNYYTYRLFLSPIDVSSRWYQYFPSVSGRHIGLQGLTPADREHSAETHPARLVGAWAYGARFPDKYLETAQAYASVDADAYARFGLAGILGVGVIVIALRLALKRLKTSDALGQTLYAIALVLAGLLWPMASIQAVLVSNGLAVVIVLMMLAHLESRWRNKQPQGAFPSGRQPSKSG
jgi:hypothetical protein